MPENKLKTSVPQCDNSVLYADNTCARTDAVFVRRADCKSHMKGTLNL